MPSPSVAEPEALPVEGFRGTPEEIERHWYAQVYRGRGDSMRQLTWRAVLMGSLLGGVLSLTNLYIGLKAGWGFGVAITACILSYAIWTALLRAGLARTPMTILENNCMQSTASSAGYSTGGTLISAFAAYMLLNDRPMALSTMLAWVFLLSVLGVTMAIPMKRQMINVEQLRFPSGIAAAETLRALHSAGCAGSRSARALAWAGLVAVVAKFWAEGLVLVHAALAPLMIGTWMSALNQRLFGPAWMGRTVMLSWEPMFIAAGAITGMRVCWSMLLGSVTAWMVFAPILQSSGVIEGGGYAQIVQWTLWGGVACMVTSSLLACALQWRTAARAFAGLGAMFNRGRPAADDPLAAIETPGAWLLAGQLVGFVGLAWLGHATFGMPYWQTAVAVLLSFALALVACRVTGETDTTPVGAMGKITQLTFGVLSPGNVNVNLMSANVTAAAAGSSADLLTDLKSGYLLGAHPRQQFLAQFAGIFRRHAGERAGVPAAGARRLGPRLRPVPGTGRPDLAGGGSGALARHPRSRPGQAVVHRDRRPGGRRADAAPEGAARAAPAPGAVAGRPRPGLDLPLVLRRAVLPRCAARVVGGAAPPAMGEGAHLSGGVGLDRRREPDGRGARHVGERAGAAAGAARPLAGC
jgi:OPT oligopeptide transporter protein